MYPFERFTDEAKGVLTLAQYEAEGSHSAYIGTEDLVIGLICQEGIARRALLNLGQSVDGLRTAVEEARKKRDGRGVRQLIPSFQVKTVVEIAFDEARRQASSHVGTDHILVAILREGNGLGASVLASRGVTIENVRAEIDRLRTAGVDERETGQGWVRRRHSQVEVVDAKGRPIEVDIAFPAEYSDEECQAVIARIKGVFRAG